jgi:DNA mismatch repair protein MutL
VPIRVLSPEVAARIAAGEVIERPASVVKELVENALDAGATRIAVEIEGGGTDSIRVTDDGCGVEAADLPLAFERHATSKLQDDADLERVTTLGFRGEALPSIAAVAEVVMATRATGSDSAAFIRLTPDAVPESGQLGAAPGTSVTVRRLFERLPARRKFLRSAVSEANAVASVVTAAALANPQVAFTLTVDGRQALRSSGNGDLRDAVAAAYGLDPAGAMLDVNSVDEAPISVRGLVGPPQISRSSRSYVSLFVNGRPVQSRRLSFAVEEAYRGMLMVGRHPVAILFVEAPPEDVDVNVHPTKAEVKFRDESAVFGAVQKAVRAALVAGSPVPAGVGVAAPSGAGYLALGSAAWTPPLWEAGIRREREGERDGGNDGAPVAAELRAEAGATPAVTLPMLRVIGQFGSIYIIAEGPEGMYLIDQHAAHERVLYEQFYARRRAGKPQVQGLLEPLTLDLPPRQRAVLVAEAPVLAEHGFEIEPFGDSAFIVRSVPQGLGGASLRDNIGRFLDTLLEEGGGDRGDRVAMSMACHGAIRAGKTLTLEEMRELIRQLEETEAPHTCPHGRPTMVHMSGEMLARGFGRR